MYAWIIDKDHQDDGAEGTIGPRDAPDVLADHLSSTPGRHNVTLNGGHYNVFTFKMYDDDRTLYYTGRLITDDASEEACYAPLGDFGSPWGGCVEITYPGHKDMDCG